MSFEILKTKITEVDKFAESDLDGKISSFYSMAKYENGRFRSPNIKEVSNTFLNSISERKIMINEEIGRVCKTSGYSIQAKEYSALEALVYSIFAETRFNERLNRFIEGIEIAARRYGLIFALVKIPLL